MSELSMEARSVLALPEPRKRAAQVDAGSSAPGDRPLVDVDAQDRRGPPLGCELHPVVYISVVAAYGWMLAAAWLAFGNSGRSEWVLAVSTGIFLMFFALPFVGMRLARAHSSGRSEAFIEFMSSTVETATGPLAAPEAWLQILIIPCALALAATLIGLVYSIVT